MQALPAGTYIVGVNPNPTRTGQPRFDIQCSNNEKYSTFKPEIASKAQSFVNQQGVTITISENGKWKNFEDVNPGGALPQQQVYQPVPQMATSGIPASTPVFTPAPNFESAAEVKKEQRITRGNAINAASSALDALIGTGLYLNADGVLDTDAVADAIIGLARKLAPYVAEGPVAPAAEVAPAPAADLPPGVTPEQAVAWAQAQGADVQLGAPVPTEAAAPAADAPKAY